VSAAEIETSTTSVVAAVAIPETAIATVIVTADVAAAVMTVKKQNQKFLQMTS
jgi:hypothetical protein